MASSVNLGTRLEHTVDELVRTGRYGSRSEVLREGVRLVEEREARLARFDAEIMKGIMSSQGGKSIPIEEAFDRLDKFIDTLDGQKAA